MCGPCRGQTDLDIRRIVLAAAKDDLTKTVLTLKGWLEICTDDVGEEPENFKNVRLTSPVGPDKYVEIAQRQRDLPQASEVLHREVKESTVHVRDLSRKGGRERRVAVMSRVLRALSGVSGRQSQAWTTGRSPGEAL